MKFVYASLEEATAEITEAVHKALEYGSVLLLVSGGSNIQTAVNVRRSLAKPNNTLTIGLVDERFGPVGHTDSNWTQLLAAGLDTKHIGLLPVITNNLPLADTGKAYAERLHEAISNHDTVIGIFGIGTDGHTAGMLLDSPALQSHELVSYFNGPDYPRITITPAAMRFFNEAFLVSHSPQKRDQLTRLQKECSIEIQPAQVLKQISNLVVYADYIDPETHK